METTTPILDDTTFFNRLKLTTLPPDMRQTIINNYNKLLNETQLKSILLLALKNKLLLEIEANPELNTFLSLLNEKRMKELNGYELDISINENITTFKLISQLEHQLLSK